MTRRRTCCFAFVLLASGASARADDAIPLQLRYDAPPSCPSADAFLAQVVARAPRARPVQPNDSATLLAVVVKEVPGGSAGTLELTAPGAATSVREVSAADCAQVVAALALTTALAIDPSAALAAGPVQPAAAPPRPAPRARHRAAGSARWVVGLGGQLEALGGVAPDLVVLIRPFVQLVHESESRFGYAFRLSAARAHARVTNAEGSGDFTLWSGRFEACPLRFAPVWSLALSACVPFDAGRLVATGSRITPSERVARPWLSTGALARVEWQLLDMLVLEAAAEAYVPIVRDRFFVGDGATLHRAPAVAGGASAGIGARFP